MTRAIQNDSDEFQSAEEGSLSDENMSEDEKSSPEPPKQSSRKVVLDEGSSTPRLKSRKVVLEEEPKLKVVVKPKETKVVDADSAKRAKIAELKKKMDDKRR